MIHIIAALCVFTHMSYWLIDKVSCGTSVQRGVLSSHRKEWSTDPCRNVGELKTFIVSKEMWSWDEVKAGAEGLMASSKLWCSRSLLRK